MTPTETPQSHDTRSAPGRREPRPSLLRRLVGGLARAGVVLVVLAAGAAATVYLVKTGPEAKRRKPKRRAQLVEVSTISPSTQQVTVDVMGTVTAAQAIDVFPRVSGEVVGLDPEFEPGGRFKAGDEIAQIDPEDYQLAVEQQETEVARLAAVAQQQASTVAQRAADVAQSKSTIDQRDSDILQRKSALVEAEAALQIERGQQSIARREFELLGKTVAPEDRPLVLREPQLRTAEAARDSAKAAAQAAVAAKAAAEASLRAAEAIKESAESAAKAAKASEAAAKVALKKAKLDLARATIRAPFNAVVDAKAVDLGSQVSPGTRLGSLTGTDEYWVEVSVPVDQLKWINIPRTNGDKGSTARIANEAAWGKGVTRTGRVFRLTSALETEGRMARLLVTVPDPLALKPENANKPVLLIGSYVRVTLEGNRLDGVVALDRNLLHDGTKVWVMNDESKLDIREVGIAYRGRDRVLVAKGIAPGERVVTSDLPAPVQDMLLRTRDAKPEKLATPKTPTMPTSADKASRGGKPTEATAQ